MSSGFRLTLVWLSASVVTVFITLQMTAASLVDGQYLPVGHDAFYHARRILDAIETGQLFQFDSRMHVPAGDWVTWPWTYDWTLAKAVAVVQALSGTERPVSVLMHLPPVLGVFATTLIVLICVELRLTTGMTLLAALCFALHAFTQYQFGVGALDHHGAEQIATLGALWLGLRWFDQPEQTARAGIAGLWLGLVLGIHAGLFILQLPLLAALFLQWLRGHALPRKSAVAFAVGLLAGSIAILAPADTFWSSRFVVYYLSPFHLYVAFCTSAVVVFLSLQPRTRRSLLLLAAVASALAVPLLAVAAFSRDFLSGDIAAIRDIDEIQPPFVIATQESGLRRVSQLYSQLLWIGPIAALVSAYMAIRERIAARVYLWTASAFGLGLLLLQLRLGAFGVYFLYLPWLVLAAAACAKWPQHSKVIGVALVAVFVVAYYPTVRYQLFGGRVPAMDQQYASLRPLLPVLRDACAADPGVVLAEPGDGHLIRYFTECSVISNNFRLTPTDIVKVTESLELISMPLTRMQGRAPEVKYVLARLVAPNESPDPVLFRQLLRIDGGGATDADVVAEVAVTQPDGQVNRYLGLYRLRSASTTIRSPASSPDT